MTDVDWRRIALDALSDLRVLGISIEQMIGMTPEILREVEAYEREATSYS